MRLGKEKEHNKTCPRCGLKMLKEIEVCPDCGLVFSRLQIASNKDAKRKKLRGDRDFIINTPSLPNDVSFIKLLLLCIFLGPMGAHNFYVGRYLKGSILLVDFILLVLMVIFNNELLQWGGEELVGTVSTICGLVLLMWFWDLLQIITKKFKVPVAIDIDYDIENSKNNDLTINKENN